MEEQRERGPYKMALDRSDEQIEKSASESDPSDDIMEDDGFDAQSAHEEWDAREPEGFFKRYGAIMGFLIVGAALTWLLFNWIGATREIANISGSSEVESQLQQMESRIARLEQRSQMKPGPQTGSAAPPGSVAVKWVSKGDFDRLSGRIERLESMVNHLRIRSADTSAKKPVTAAVPKKTARLKKGVAAQKPLKAAAQKPLKAAATYTVQKGDTLYSIATKNNVSVDRLKQWNGLTENTLSVGQQLKLAP